MPPLQWTDITGWLTRAEWAELQALAKGRDVLELGSFLGRSTVCMAQTAKRIVSVDHHRGDEGTGPADTLAGFRKHLAEAGVADRVEVIHGRIEQVGDQIPSNRFGLVFIDSAHDEAAVKRDTKLALACLASGGVIVWHDWDYPSVRAGAALAGVDLAKVQTVERLGVFGRPLPPRPAPAQMKRALLSMPRYGGAVHFDATVAFLAPTGPDTRLEVLNNSPLSSILPATFNASWAMARNEWEAGQLDYFAMLHADIAPEPGWLDLLHDEIEAAGVDLLSAVVPIKDDRGLTSTAVDDTGDPWRPRRLTMHEVSLLPETFSDAQVGGPILLNTGLWIAKLGPWCLEVCFQNFNRVIRDPSTGKWKAQTQPEDWDFSRQCRDQGLILAATKRVKLRHHGDYAWDNRQVWGWKYDKVNGRPPVERK